MAYCKLEILKAGFIWVLENLRNPGILLWYFPGLSSPKKGLLVLKSSGNLLNSSKENRNVWQTVRINNNEILGVKGLKSPGPGCSKAG